MATQTQSNAPSSTAYPAGQHLRCQSCGSEIEIINPCGCKPSGQVLKCCGQDMKAIGETAPTD